MKHRFLFFLLVIILSAGCAAQNSRDSSHLERISEDTQVIETRLASLEERLTLVEQEVGVLRSRNDLPAGARRVDPAPSLARISPAISSQRAVQVSIPPASQPSGRQTGEPADQQTAYPSGQQTDQPQDQQAVYASGQQASQRIAVEKEAVPPVNTVAQAYQPNAGQKHMPPAARSTTDPPITAQTTIAKAPALRPMTADTPRAVPVSPSVGAASAVSRPQPQSAYGSPSLKGLPAGFRTGIKAYDEALALYYRQDYDKARDAFTSFIGENPGHKLLANALYWQGESAYSQGDYVSSILSFKTVTSQYAKHAKAADALLKTGMAYERLKDRDNARFYWQILLDDFPKSAAARVARGKMSR